MKILNLFKELDSVKKRALVFILLSYFCVLFNYPLVRAASTTFFFEAYGAKSTPFAWLWGILFLSLAVYLSNALQARYSVQRVFFINSILSVIIFSVGTIGFYFDGDAFTYLPFIWKEIYIVLQVHLILGYSNNFFKGSDFKTLIGVVGGVGSIGGIFAGALTSVVARNLGTEIVMWIGVLFVFLPALLFLKTPLLVKGIEDKARTPLATFNKPLKKYVGYIATLVVLAQIVINIADFNFHLVFEKEILDPSLRTSRLGDIYMYMNLVTFFLQFLVLPTVMLRVSEKNFHYFVPTSYLILLVFILCFSQSGLVALSLFFIYLKASDYSLFSAGREILYQPLSINQKYGAKYLTDMLVYRMAKAFIALVLIYIQSAFILNLVMITCLLVWIFLVSGLFKQHKILFS
jgi:AAA family ATP:ADP antiporter